MSWKPCNEPIRYDRRRIEGFRPVADAVDKLGLPLIRYRKLRGICNAIEMQIEDGGDSPAVNDHLLDALRAAVIHQVDEKAAPVLDAIETFRSREAERWEQLRSGVPLPLDPEARLDDLVEKGYLAQEQRDVRAACDHWLAAWEIVRQLAPQDLRRASAFSAQFDLAHDLTNWANDLMLELHGAGFRDPLYHERRLQFAREFLAQFPDEDSHTHVNFTRARGEALWELGRRSEAETVYGTLVERFPDDAWTYIGWSDHYWLGEGNPQDYARAEAIMTRALARPQLHDRADLLERLRELYTESGQGDKLAQLEGRGAPGPAHPRLSSSGEAAAVPPRLRAQAPKLGRNDPCWCGSGKKYKRCHLQTG